MKLKAIDLLRRCEGPLVPAEIVEKAAAMHDACSYCWGSGGTSYHPEQPCPECGFTFADSYGIESVARNRLNNG
jgi:hypothetical protein